MSKAVKQPVGRPMTNVQNIQAKYASLLNAEKTAKKNRAAFEAQIRAGNFPEAFILETPAPSYYVPANVWQGYVGDDWIEDNKVQKNQQLIIRVK